MIECVQGGEGRQTRPGGAKGRPHPAAKRIQDLVEGKPIILDRQNHERRSRLKNILEQALLFCRVLRTICCSDSVLLGMTFSGYMFTLVKTSSTVDCEDSLPFICSDSALVENLEHTKKTAAEIEEKVTEAKKTSAEIDKVRVAFQSSSPVMSLFRQGSSTDRPLPGLPSSTSSSTTSTGSIPCTSSASKRSALSLMLP